MKSHHNGRQQSSPVEVWCVQAQHEAVVQPAEKGSGCTTTTALVGQHCDRPTPTVRAPRQVKPANLKERSSCMHVTKTRSVHPWQQARCTAGTQGLGHCDKVPTASGQVGWHCQWLAHRAHPLSVARCATCSQQDQALHNLCTTVNTRHV